MELPVSENISIVAQLIIDRTKALVAIQELHKPVVEHGVPVGCLRCDWDEDGQWPCDTRKLADEALGGDGCG